MGLIKNNPALAVGIGLPVLVVLFFALASLIPTWLVAPPQYDALFTLEIPNYITHEAADGETKFEVLGGQLKAYRRFDEKHMNTGAHTQLYIFDARTLKARGISLPPTSIPSDADKDWHEMTVPDTQSLTLDPSPVAPDGYEFHDRFGQGPGLWPLYGSVSDRNGFSIGKSGRDIRVMVPNATFYGNNGLRFLGWVVKVQHQ
jgi:hypothetical protein